ncbi:MAG TPA: PEP-CTERM sorting domain-containing protein [Opitutaceae bacterium]|nr:PEP-CTERM sorting domain-containing protein [Opitutaceae bacterium]
MRLLLVALALAATAAQAQIIAYTDRFGYTGSVTRYATLADAQSASNALATFTLGESRDFRVQLFNGFSPFVEDQYHIGTNWMPPGSPSNTAAGFVQVPLQYGANSVHAFWDATLTQFSFDAHGALDAPNARLWDGTPAAANQSGRFLDYHLWFVASGLDPAFWLAGFETYASVGDPAAVTGGFSGLFENTSASASGFYTFDFQLNLDNWAFANFGPYESEYYIPSFFAAPNAVPEPSTYGLLGAIALTALVLGRRLSPKRG